MKHIWPSVCLLAIFTLLLGFAYPLAVMQFGQRFYPDQANGSLMEKDGKIIGSYLIGYTTHKDVEYFHARPSNAAVTDGILVGLASNVAQTNPKMMESYNDNFVAWLEETPGQNIFPTEMGFASGGGLDPNISFASATQQIERIALARKLPPDDLYAMIGQYRKQVPLLKLDYVNVNRLNRGLDQLQASPDDRQP